MSEDPHNDPLIKARDRAIETIAVHLNTARSLAETDPPRISPGALAELIEHIERVLVLLDGIHVGQLPEQVRERPRSTKAHLQAAGALAEEHLADADAQGKARSGIETALGTLADND